MTHHSVFAVLALSLLVSLAGCASSFDSSLEVKAEVFTGDIVQRPTSSRRLEAIDADLDALAEISRANLTVSNALQSAHELVVAFDQLTSMLLWNVAGRASDDNAAFGARCSSTYNPDPIRTIRRVLYGHELPLRDGQPRVVTADLTIPPAEISTLVDALSSAALLIRNNEAAAELTDNERSLVARSGYEIRRHSLQLLQATAELASVRTASSNVNVDAILTAFAHGGAAVPERALDLKVEIDGVVDILNAESTREVLVGFVFFTARTFQTAFGTTWVEVIDPADPRLRDIAAAEPGLWKNVSDRAYAKGDGANQIVIVQESPIHYRVKSFDSDPRSVASLNVSFAEQGLKILDEVVGAAASVYGVSAIGVLGDPLGVSNTVAPDAEQSAVSTARAQISAAQSIATMRRDAEAGDLRSVRIRVDALIEQAVELQRQFDEYSNALRKAEADVATAAGDSAKAAAQKTLDELRTLHRSLRSRAEVVKQEAIVALSAATTIIETYESQDTET